MNKIAIILLNEKGFETANFIKSNFETAEIYGLKDRVNKADHTFQDTGVTLRNLYNQGTTIIGLCSSGILIRTLATELSNKHAEPPVLAAADDGSLFVPLLGGLTGANELAKSLADLFHGKAAITASGARHYNVQLEAPPETYTLVNKQDAKRITSDILNGKTVSLNGQCSWLEETDIPFTPDGEIEIKVSIYNEALPKNGLLYHPKSVLIEINDEKANHSDINAAFADLNISTASIAGIITKEKQHSEAAKKIANQCGVPYIENLCGDEQHVKQLTNLDKIIIIELEDPITPNKLVNQTGKLTIVGLGPGKPDWQTSEVKTCLRQADSIFGYQTYVDMVPVKNGQKRFASDNRVEVERAREALDYANQGHNTVIVSSGDPGIFAMASAVMEVIENEPNNWQNIDLEILPGISAMQGAASLVGAPIGHDFAVISLSDIRKPFEQIKQRLIATAEADFVTVIYNPASKTRRHQIEVMKELLLSLKAEDTPVLLAKNIAREKQEIIFTNLKDMNTEQIDMRTLIVIGSSKTKVITGPKGKKLMYTPRTYQDEGS